MIYELLKQYVGLERKDADNLFAITETDTEWILTSQYLERETYAAMRQLVHDKGGSYTPGSKHKRTVFSVPKPMDARSKEGQAPVPRAPPSNEEGDYSLARSMKSKLRQLVPCLKDAEGLTIDGFHRLKINPDAWTVKLDHIKTPVDRAAARMAVNFCRRHYTSEEMTNDVGLLIGAGYTVQQIAEVTGISERTVYRYMPEHLKKSEPEQLVETHLKKPDIVTAVTESEVVKFETPQFKSAQEQIASEIVPCENCGQPTHRTRMKLAAGKLQCPRCLGELTKSEPKKLEEEIKKFKPVEKWEHRVQTMKVQKSKQEMDLLSELATRGITPETDVPIPLWSTIPDGVYRNKKLVYYVHGEPHDKVKALERDDEILSALEKEGWNVLVFRHNEGTVKEWADKIQEFLKW